MTLGPNQGAGDTLNPPMNFRFIALAVLPASLLLAVACGDDDLGTIDNAKTATPGGSPTAASAFGPAPVLGGNVLEVTPQHAATVPQASTRSPNPQQPRGICAKVSFEGLPQYGQWFRMALDGNEVTEELTWILPTQNNPTGGTVCFAPTEGLSVGEHATAISVQDPSNPSAASKQVVAWKFAVSE